MTDIVVKIGAPGFDSVLQNYLSQQVWRFHVQLIAYVKTAVDMDKSLIVIDPSFNKLSQSS